jgi:polyferredoxin
MGFIKSDRKAQKRVRQIRRIFLILILVFTTVIGLLHQYSKGVKPAGVDAFCPFGGIESAYTLITTGEMIKRVTTSSFILLIATIIIALLFRRSFCGNICAFGFLQELFGRLGRMIFRKRPEVPGRFDRAARYLKYGVLLVIVVFSWKMGELIIRPYDPWAAYHHVLSSELFLEFKIGFIVLIVTLLGSIVFDRFFCKYMCPMGAFLGMIYRGGWFRIRRSDNTCTHCMACDRICPVNIPVESIEEVKTSECINCNLCVNVCPVKDTLFIKGPKKRRVSPGLLLWVTIVIFVTVPGISTLTGNVSWTIKPLKETIKDTGGFDPEEIRGSNTFREVSEITGIPEKEFIKRFKISEEEFEKPIKDSAHKPDSSFDTEDVRDFVRERID